MVNESNIITHEFYAKAVSPKSVIHSSSALPDNVKRTVLSQEGLRRLLNCSRELPWNVMRKPSISASLRSASKSQSEVQSTHIDAYARKKIAEKDRYTDRDPGMPPSVETTSLRNDPSGSEKMVKRPCYLPHQRRIHHLQERYDTFRRTAT